MNITINLATALERATDLMVLSSEELEARTKKELEEYAKTLSISKWYNMRKDELLQAIWQQLEQLRGMLQVETQKAEEGKKATKQIRKNDNYTIPISEIAGKVYGQLREIGINRSDLSKMKEAVNPVVMGVARREEREFTFSTVKSRRNEIKDALQAMVDSEPPYTKQIMQDLFDYFYSQLLAAQKEESIIISKKYKQEVRAKNRGGKSQITISQLVKDCREILRQLEQGKQPHWTKVSIAIALGTGRRMAEIHALGSFEVTGEYLLHFSGQAKTRDADGAKTDYEILTLFPARLMKMGIEYLESEGRRLDESEQFNDRKAVNNAFGMALSRAMGKYKRINYKGLRAVYADLLWYLNKDEYEEAGIEKHTKYSDWLGHIDKDGRSDETFMSYMVYKINDPESIKN